MNVDTGQFEAITERADRLAGELEATRRITSLFYEAGYNDAGGPAAARTAYRLGFAAGRDPAAAPPEDVTAAAPARHRHLRAVT